MSIVADEIVQFMKFLSAHGMNINQSSIAGHRLSAYVAGLVGARFHGKIDAIYGTFFEFIYLSLKCKIECVDLCLPNVEFRNGSSWSRILHRQRQ